MAELNFEEELILENGRVCLKPLNVEHIPDLTPIAIKHPKLLQYSPPKFGTAEHLATYVKNNLTLRIQHKKYPFVIYDKKAEAIAGSTSFLNISQKDLRLEIGSTWLAEAFQRTGLNRNCKFLLLQYVFETLDFERVEFKTDGRNKQSQTAILALGAKYEGALRSHTVMSDGHRRDTLYYSILKNEWAAVKKRLQPN